LAYQERKNLISRLETARGSRVLCYFLSDRETLPPNIPGFSTQLASEPQLLFIDQLRAIAIGRTECLDLFLYTRGGAVDSVWPLVILLREYCEKLRIIVPFRAHSGGTLICLGADEIVMTHSAELSPIDPATGNQFNPTDPITHARLGISVEDVVSYFKLSEERAGITQEPYKLEVLKELTKQVHPLALGNIQRVYLQIRHLAHKLLALHMDPNTNLQKINEIVKVLTEEFYSHVHAITYKEAVSLLGEWVKLPTQEEELIIWDLFNSYAETLKLRDKFNLPEHIKDALTYDLKVIGAFIESTELSHVYITELKALQRPNLPPNIQVPPSPEGFLPLPIWATRVYDYNVYAMGWRTNHEEL